MFYLYSGFSSGQETLNVKLIDKGSISAGGGRTRSVSAYYVDVMLGNGEKIRLMSKDPELLFFNGGLIDVESYYSPLRLKTVYVLK